MAPEATPGAMAGSVTRRKAESGGAPSDWAARVQVRIVGRQCGGDGDDDEGQRQRRVRQHETGARIHQAERAEEQIGADGNDHHRHDHGR